MFRKIAVGDIMTRNFASASSNDNLLDCAKKMVKQKVGCLLITNHKRLIGLLTQKDILWAITKKPDIDLKRVKAMDVATKKVAVISPLASISEAFQKMKKYGFRRLPVISRGELVGFLTIKDILSVEPSFYNQAGELFNLREETEKLKRASKENLEEEGLCENCGEYSDLLDIEGRSLCDNCRNELY